MTELYSVKDVAKILGLQESRLRYWAQTGFVGPSVRRGSRSFYTFQDLISVKVAKELLDGGQPLQRVRRNLEALQAALPQIDRPLSRLRVCCDGDRLVVLDDDLAFEPSTGQLMLSFAVSSLSSQVAQVLALPGAATAAPARAQAQGAQAQTQGAQGAQARTQGAQAQAHGMQAQAQEAAPPPSTAYAAFVEGLRAEEAGDEGRAESLYRRAVALDNSLAAAWTNLGNMLDRHGARGEAREAYEKALALDPEQPEARYNLANLLADVGELELAMAEYRRVTAACPEFADAHFNLALLYARVGALVQAKTELKRYLDLDSDSDSEWARQARDYLASL